MHKLGVIVAMVAVQAIVSSSFSQSTVQTLVLRPGPDEGTDADIRTDLPQTPRGTSQDFIANAWTAQGNYFTNRSLLKFDLSQVPVTANVIKATLFLYTNLNSGHYQLDSGANASYLLRVLEPWSEDQVCWDNQPAASPQNPVILPQSTSNTQTYEIDVTADVGDMITNPALNFGWLFRLQTEEKYRCLVFASSDNAVGEWRPMLVVQYEGCLAPSAGFFYEYSGTTVNFTDTSLCHHPLAWWWDFGDSTNAAVQNPVHDYGQDGTYHVCLTISDSCGQDTFCRDIWIYQPLQPGFDLSQNETSDLTVTFSDKSNGADRWQWDFGDGNTSAEQNPVHSYQQYGDYLVCLTAGNRVTSETACSPLSLRRIGGESSGRNITLYPNPYPGNGSLYFMVSEDAALAGITITDITGKTVLNLAYRDVRKNEPVELSISGLAKGTYLLKISFNNFRKIMKLVVI